MFIFLKRFIGLAYLLDCLHSGPFRAHLCHPNYTHMFRAHVGTVNLINERCTYNKLDVLISLIGRFIVENALLVDTRAFKSLDRSG